MHSFCLRYTLESIRKYNGVCFLKKAFIVWSMLILILTSCQIPYDHPVQSTPELTPQRKDSVNNPKIIVHKADRLLYIYDDDALVASMNIALGFTPKGHKQREGDGKTPEGEYTICYRNENSRYYLSLGISYPNLDDATKAYEENAISEGQYKAIKKAHEYGQAPLWNTALGGEIMIHGHGTKSDWTAGCIAVENEDMDYLWSNCPIGTPVIIKP